MYCLPSTLLYVATTTTLLLLAMVSMLVDGKLPDTSIVKGPDSFGKSPGREYNDNVRHLIDSFVHDTKGAPRNIHGDRQFNNSYPNPNPGSPFGVSTCYMDLGKAGCSKCLLSGKHRLSFGCLHPVSAPITLVDCSIWFNVTSACT